MPELPEKKVGIISCSGEEISEGTVARLTALRVLEQLRPGETVTICLPLFLAGGEGDRAFAKFYPTIAIDGCEKRCAYRGTELYSNRPAAGIVITDLIKQNGMKKPEGKRKLDSVGMNLVELAADQVAQKADELLGKSWSRHEGAFKQPEKEQAQGEVVATCSCGSGVPIQKVLVNGHEMTIVALPLIFQKLQQNGRTPGAGCGQEIMEMIKIYNQVDLTSEKDLLPVVIEEYSRYWMNQGQKP